MADMFERLLEIINGKARETNDPAELDSLYQMRDVVEGEQRREAIGGVLLATRVRKAINAELSPMMRDGAEYSAAALRAVLEVVDEDPPASGSPVFLWQGRVIQFVDALGASLSADELRRIGGELQRRFPSAPAPFTGWADGGGGGADVEHISAQGAERGSLIEGMVGLRIGVDPGESEPPATLSAPPAVLMTDPALRGSVTCGECGDELPGIDAAVGAGWRAIPGAAAPGERAAMRCPGCFAALERAAARGESGEDFGPIAEEEVRRGARERAGIGKTPTELELEEHPEIDGRNVRRDIERERAVARGVSTRALDVVPEKCSCDESQWLRAKLRTALLQLRRVSGAADAGLRHAAIDE